MSFSNEQLVKSSQLIQSLFRQVRPIVLKNAGNIDFVNKADGTPVTDTDVQIEEIVCSAFKSQFPDLPIFGEEGGYDEDNLPDLCWLIDPIDGTKSFIENSGTFTSMAVLIRGKEPVMSIVYNPTTGDMHTATKGSGAYKNGQKIDLSTVDLPAVAFCKGRFIKDLDAITKQAGVRNQKGPIGAGYGFSQICDGKAAAKFHLPGKGQVHDYAVGMLLITEAGGDVIPVLESTFNYQTRSFVTCHPSLSEVILQNIQNIKTLQLNLAD